MALDFERRLWAQIDIRDHNECWPPKYARRALEREVYAQFNLGKARGFKVVTMPRAVLMAKLGRDLRPGMVVCHTCNWMPCCNPSHLIEGTQRHNSMMRSPEMRARGAQAIVGMPRSDTFREKQRIAQLTSRMRTCAECGMRTNAGAMVKHQRSSGHVGVV